MWVIRKNYYFGGSHYERMLCDHCFNYEVRQYDDCPCRELFGNCRKQQSEFPETREVCQRPDGPCAECYWRGPPCQDCWGDGFGSWKNRVPMTYEEFSQAWIKLGQETCMPSYETFQKYNGSSPQPTYSQVLQGITKTW